ncbi:MAG: type II secretion system protein J [Candidatus Brocadiia bacterium]
MLAPRSPRRGVSYVELCLAMAILGLCLVPATRMLPDLLVSHRRVETEYRLSLVAREKLEETVLALEARFQESTDSGDLAAQGRPDWHYDVDVTIPPDSDGRYAIVRARAWEDADGGGERTPEDGDLLVRFDTIAANRKWGGSP